MNSFDNCLCQLTWTAIKDELDEYLSGSGRGFIRSILSSQARRDARHAKTGGKMYCILMVARGSSHADQPCDVSPSRWQNSHCIHDLLAEPSMRRVAMYPLRPNHDHLEARHVQWWLDYTQGRAALYQSRRN